MELPAVVIDRAATAIRRNAASRPCTLLLANDLAEEGDNILDYGCGYGEDVDHLAKAGYEARGWDPHHRPDGDRSEADVVLCSYVLNVIEDPAERHHVLGEVHRLARRVVVIAVRTTAERGSLNGYERHGDGWITAKNTFQTVWTQTETRQLIEHATGTPPIALAPGVFAVFKASAAEEAWREAIGDRIRRARIRRGPPIHRPGVLEQAYDAQRGAYEALWVWVQGRGRLPEDDEVPEAALPAVEAAGSVGRAGLVLRYVKDEASSIRRAGAFELAYEAHKDAFDALWSWIEKRGRLPLDDEVPDTAQPAVEAAGSIGHAGAVLRHIHEPNLVRRAGALELAYEAHKDAFDALWSWIEERGRLPLDDEVPGTARPAVDAAGSVGHAGAVLRQVKEATDSIRRAGKREIAYDQNTDAYDALLEFALTHGRLPEEDEVPSAALPAIKQAGSVGHAGLVLRHRFGDEPITKAADERREELTARFALARLRNRRAKCRDLPTVVQRDVRTLFGSYKSACREADMLLMSLGDPTVLRAAATKAPVGKLTNDSLYVHTTALDLLPAELRLYHACAQVIAGSVDGANIVKFHLDKPRISYLVYPNFDTDPHPALAESWVADLRNLDLRPTDYTTRENPPILHRKDLFVAPDHPRYATFRRLTEQEERHGLLGEVLTIGTRKGWEQRLTDNGWRLTGHRLVRR